MQGHPLRGPTDRIRLAELTLDSDQSPEVDLLVSAARDAIALTNVTLGERLARAAVNRGGGLVASELLARSLLWQGNSAEAEETLSAFDPGAMNELELVRWGLVRIANLHWSMGDAEGADEVLNLLSDRVAQPGLKLVVAGVASASRLFENELEEAVELSELVLASQDASAAAVEWAVFGGALALALMGRGDEVEAVAERGHQIDDKVDGLLRYLTAFGEVRALVIGGDFDTAAQRSADIVRITSAGQYLAWGMANVLVGTVELGRGRFADTVSRMEQTVAALTSESAASWSFPARLLLAQSYCALSRTEAGAKMVAELVPAAASTSQCSAHSCGSPRLGSPPRRETSASQSNWRSTPHGWRRSRNRPRSRCWRCTTRCGSATRPAWIGWSISPPASAAAWRRPSRRMPQRRATMTPPNSPSRRSSSSGWARCCRRPMRLRRRQWRSRRPTTAAAVSSRPRRRRGLPQSAAGSARPRWIWPHTRCP